MRMNSYLNFNGNCEAAFKFYEQCFGGKLDPILVILRHGEAPTAEHIPADWHDKIMHASLNLGGQLLMGCDAPPGYYDEPKGYYVQLAIDDTAEAERVFHTLAENGKVTMPFAPTFWAHRFGMLRDQFGILWMVNCEKAA